MDNFEFLVPTKVIFGKGVQNDVGTQIMKICSGKVLLHYGGKSAKQSGLLTQICTSFDKCGIDYIELGGVRPNPRLSLVRQGIELCRNENVEFILAVGGGSVIDSAKAISLGVCYEGDVWDFFSGKATPEKAMPIGAVLTIPAAGSETSNSCVITNDEDPENILKKGCNCEVFRAKFALMNPELCYTLPSYQIACGSVDILAHIMERYFTNTENVELTDKLCEAAMRTVVSLAPRVLADPGNYDNWANLMWAGSLAHNGIFSTGRVGDWASHKIEHEISAIYDIAHGAGLAITFPAWLKYIYKHDEMRVAQFANRVFDVELDFHNAERTALEGIRRLEEFYRSLGLVTTLSECGIDDSRLEEMSKKATNGDSMKLGQFVQLTSEDILEIYRLAL